MKLYYNAASPFVRKVRVVARELGLDKKIEEIATAVSPVKVNTDLAPANPLVKIPTLVADDGTALYDSPVICEYLDSLSSEPRLIPASGAARWNALRLQALADGILDAGILCRYELAMRPKELHWADWISGQKLKWHSALDALEQDVKSLAGAPTVGSIAVACALGWLDFRFGDDHWRATRPGLARWYQEFVQRPAMQATMPSA